MKNLLPAAQGQKLDDLVGSLKHFDADIVALSGGGNELIGDDFPSVLQTPDRPAKAIGFIAQPQLSKKIFRVIGGLEHIIQTLIATKSYVQICAHIVDQFDAALVLLSRKYLKNFFRVGLRGISKGKSANWADEIHLNSETAALAANEFLVQFKNRLGSALKLRDK